MDFNRNPMPNMLLLINRLEVNFVVPIRCLPNDTAGGNSTKLGESMMEEMGLNRSTKWSG